MSFSRRTLLKALTSSAIVFPLRKILATPAANRIIAPGPFQPTWDSLKHYQIPEWFRDVKFGIWAHWDAQCVPEAGDWYARQMYMQGNDQYESHLKNYGHPSKFGFMEFDNLWKAEQWQPEELMQLYVNAGAKYFMSLANHHDNFDCYNSRYHNWNSVRVGPRRDIVGTWARVAREHGLKFGVSNHSAHAWHWLQTAYDYDPEGPLAGVRYDAYTLTKEDGKGKWWEGLDPQELYAGRNIVMPDGIHSIKDANAWHEAHDRVWDENPPAMNPEYAEKWFLRCQDLLDQYHPDLLYFDNYGYPMGQAGRDIVTHYYNSSVKLHGTNQAVVFSKNLKPEEEGTLVYDIERGRAKGILKDAWQTDTCIGDWHYSRSIFEQHRYKSVRTVVQMLVDIVSKNGNLLLSVPMRGNGTIDEDEHKFLIDLAAWMKIHGEAIFATRPFFIEGEGKPDVQNNADFNESSSRPYTAEDIRFTTKGNTLYAFVLGAPMSNMLTIKTLTKGRSEYPRTVQKVEMLGRDGALTFRHDERGLMITLPKDLPNDFAFCFRIH
jgi:alpha-L-fucosidase